MPPVEGLRGTAMVTKGGSVEADLAGGMADIEAGVPCTSATRFQLCSVSKQFTAAAVMLLAGSGRLDLGEPVARWLPEGPPQWRQVTLHELLSHTAGVPHWREAPGLDPAEPMKISERLEIIQATPLRTEPGAQWHYSSPGFLLAGLIVERASGQPYREFLAERILSPLNWPGPPWAVPRALRPAATRTASRWRPLTWTRCPAPATSGPPRAT
jgi:CubicO group peptidase (beta-lactamase class C family)